MADNWKIHIATLRHPDQASRTRLEAALKDLLDLSKQDESARLRLAQEGALAPLIAVAASEFPTANNALKCSNTKTPPLSWLTSIFFAGLHFCFPSLPPNTGSQQERANTGLGSVRCACKCWRRSRGMLKRDFHWLRLACSRSVCPSFFCSAVPRSSLVPAQTSF
eukprot:1914137-Rhodomonas_salina.2